MATQNISLMFRDTLTHFLDVSAVFWDDIIDEGHEYWTQLRNAQDKVRKIAIGCFVGILQIPLLEFVERKIVDLMKLWRIDAGIPSKQMPTAIWNYLSKFPKVFSICFKTAFIGFVTILVPILAEWAFRYKLDWLLKQWLGDTASTANKVVRVVANGLIFGASGLNPWLGWANVPIFFCMFFMGCTMAALKEMHGDTIASTTALFLLQAVGVFSFLATA